MFSFVSILVGSNENAPAPTGEFISIASQVCSIQNVNLNQVMILIVCSQIDSNVPDEVRDFWRPACVEIGIPPMLTMPGVQMTNDLVKSMNDTTNFIHENIQSIHFHSQTDPIKDAVLFLLGDAEASQRKILTADDVTQDERGICQLIEAGCFRSAINLTARCLSIFGQGYGRTGQPTKHSPHSLQIWFTRFALLLKIGEFSMCQREAEAFGLLNRADIYYDVIIQLNFLLNECILRNCFLFHFSFILKRIADEKVQWHRFHFVYYLLNYHYIWAHRKQHWID